jgi:hypothetical protein
MRIDIRIEENPYIKEFYATDAETYDAEVVDGEWTSSSAVGTGLSPWQAALDLLHQMMDNEVE